MLLLCVVALAAQAVAASATTFTGEVYSRNAQPIYVPPTETSPVVLRYFVRDGMHVDAGDVVLRIDVGEAESKLRDLRTERDKQQLTAAVDEASLRLKALQAERDVVDAEAARDEADIEAVLPVRLLSKLDAERFRGAKAEADSDLAYKKHGLETAIEAWRTKQADTGLQKRIFATREAALLEQLKTAEIKAVSAGVVTHRFDSIIGDGRRYDEGSSSYTGVTVGEVVAAGAAGVNAWIFEADRPAARVGQTVWLQFDAFPGVAARGRITAIAGAAEPKKEWGKGRYFAVAIDIDGGGPPGLKPGMSVRVDTSTPPPPKPDTPEARPARIVVAGEVAAAESTSIAPPEVEGLWDMTITYMLPEGHFVHRGDHLVSFDGAEVFRRLQTRRGELEEKRRLQVKTRLELAEDERTQLLALAKATGDLEKATRQAIRVSSVIPGIEAKKLLIEKARAQRALVVARRISVASAAERDAKQDLVDSQVASLDGDIRSMQRQADSLKVVAPRDGIFVHTIGWDGRKVDSGAKIWRSKAVGDIPDVHTLYVLASIPERRLSAIARGRRVRVTIEGDSRQVLGGFIARIGDTAHSRSAVEPVPVIDFHVQLDKSDTTLLPGQPVTVEVLP